MKNKLALLYFLSLSLWTKDLASGNSFHRLILWNTGYSQYQTLINDHTCLHIDPGGTLLLPLRAIYILCQNKFNNYTYLQNDKYHTSYINKLIKVFPKTKEIHETQLSVTNLISKSHSLVSYAHLKKDQFEHVVIHKPKVLESYTSILLPNHGQPKFLTKDNIKLFLKFNMLITGSQSIKYENHVSTEKRLLRAQNNLILKNKWGHLIFETKF